jgi:hypothetical protein
MQDLLEHLRSLEVALHHPGVRSNPEHLDALLHPDFVEVGRSGSQYDRRTVIDHLRHGTAQSNVVSDGFTLSALAQGVALLTYRSAHRNVDGGLVNRTHRASVWVETPSGWQLRYHQGTPAALPW